ncbi:MAG: sigma-70 family RNA polymerase sigma factor [Verrucomicrobia bacterium]|nr:sigma-70 family RNA polymerase sigma factor [Verrucomicrobiota bacterium]
MTDGQQLLAQYVKTGSETAFHELVARYVDLVYSAAIRLVNGDTHRAEDVTQTVFADLARQARTLSREVMLGGWLHRHACFVASKTMRTERRREARERQSVAMSALEDHSAANLALIAPMLDEAVDQLADDDRTAIMLRFFEQHDYRSVGEAMGSNEEAARKRVDRALDKLQSLLKARGVVLSATALGTTLATQTVTAAPVGFALTISSVALAGAATGGGTTLTVLEIMSMTKLKVGIVTAVVAAGVSIPWVMEHRTQTRLTEANEALRQQTEQNNELEAENARLNKLASEATTARASANSPSLELLRLRGEVARLHQDLASERTRTNGPSALSGIKADPAMWDTIRAQQKMGMGSIYKDFAKRFKLPDEQAEQLNDLLADNVMENIDHITAVLRDGLTPAQMEPIFAGQEAAMLEKVQALLGPEGLEDYKEYTRRLASNITAEQLKGMLTGDKTEQEAKARKVYELMLQETQQTLASAGLPSDFQTLPILNFRNIASETEAEKNLKLMDGVYERVIASSGSILSPEDVAKFDEFRAKAVNAQRMSLIMNRKMMSPGSR